MTSTPRDWSTGTSSTWHPALFGGDDARPLFAGPGAATIADLWRGQVRSMTSLGGDIRVELAPPAAPT